MVVLKRLANALGFALVWSVLVFASILELMRYIPGATLATGEKVNVEAGWQIGLYIGVVTLILRLVGAWVFPEAPTKFHTVVGLAMGAFLLLLSWHSSDDTTEFWVSTTIGLPMQVTLGTYIMAPLFEWTRRNFRQ